MASLCNITLIGNLGRDPETRYTPNGRMNVQFTMAVSRNWTDQGGQRQESTQWFRVTAWGRLAETLDNLSQQQALAKGKQVFVSGRFEAREYQDQNGQTRTSLDVNADQLLLLGSRADSELGGGQRSSGERPQSNQQDPFDASDIDDVPF
jgi:single-strand DNA-binding protein